MNSQAQKLVSKFFDQYETKLLSAHEIIIYAGEEPRGVFYLMSGEVRQYDVADNGSEMTINVFKPAAFFPMGWAINKTPNKYFFETVSDSVVQIAPAAETVKFIKDNPEVTYDLLSRLFSGVDGILQRTTQLMGGSAKTRVIFELLVQCQRLGERQEDGSYIVNLHEEALAARAGLSRETVSRSLKELKSLGLVVVDRKSITVKNLDKLQSLVEDKV